MVNSVYAEMAKEFRSIATEFGQQVSIIRVTQTYDVNSGEIATSEEILGTSFAIWEDLSVDSADAPSADAAIDRRILHISIDGEVKRSDLARVTLPDGATKDYVINSIEIVNPSGESAVLYTLTVER